jgi:parallel beta-helix repeat protein
VNFQLLLQHISFSSLIFLSLTNISEVYAQNTPKPALVPSVQLAPQVQTIFYVNPQSGTDSVNAGKSETAAFRTITYALQQATPGTIIQLASGRYSNESFPLIVKSDVTLKGNESMQGQGVEIIGGDAYMSRIFAKQDVTLVAQDNSQILGITITNPNVRGSGIWIESGQPIIRNDTFINSKREGVFITGNAAPRIENNRFINNDANGVSVTKDAKGEIRHNTFENTGFGIAIGGNSAPLVSDNQIRSNRNGIVLTDSAQPKLLSNTIENNRDYGLVVIGQARPNLDRNSFRGNQIQDQFQVIPTLQQAPPE